MGLEAEQNSDAPARLIAAGRTLLEQGEAGFSLSRLCAQAGVTLGDFRASFASKAELMQQLIGQKVEAPPAHIGTDPWLERRLRVFERALGALEEKADKRDREARHAIARLEERLAELGGAQLKFDVAAAVDAAAPQETQEPAPQPEPAEEEKAETPNPLLLAPLAPVPAPKLDTADLLEQARRAALAAHDRAQARQRRRRRQIPTRMLIVGTLAILLLLACAALTLVRASFTPLPAGGGVAQRMAAASPLAQLMLRGDSGDIAAQRALALAYLRGDGVEKNPEVAALWARAAAQGGDAEAQYLLGNLTTRHDPAQAFTWFARAAEAGHLKAMHSLGIAYAQGQGTARDEAAAAAWFARAAARGYVDSAFNLAVLYERGHGVAQDPQLALRWYRAAAKQGDSSAAARARLLSQQAGL